jgi:hypothetical protein
MSSTFTGLRAVVAASAVIAAATGVLAQEKPVPKDSARVQIAGCAKKSTFTVRRPPEGEPTQTDIAPGRHFTLHAKKDLLADIHAHERSMIEVTGLVRRSDLGPQPGVSLGGGRIRITPGEPEAPLGGNPASSPQYTRPVIDVEAWRILPADCR